MFGGQFPIGAWYLLPLLPPTFFIEHCSPRSQSGFHVIAKQGGEIGRGLRPRRVSAFSQDPAAIRELKPPVGPSLHGNAWRSLPTIVVR